MSIIQEVIEGIIGFKSTSFTGRDLIIVLPQIKSGTVTGRIADLKRMGALTMAPRGHYTQNWDDGKMHKDGIVAQTGVHSVPKKGALDFTPDFTVMLSHKDPQGKEVKAFMGQVKNLKRFGWKVEID